MNVLHRWASAASCLAILGAGCSIAGTDESDGAPPHTMQLESIDAQARVDRMRSQFVVRPAVDEDVLAELDLRTPPAPVLPPSQVSGFVRESGSLVPLFAQDAIEGTARVRIEDHARRGFHVGRADSDLGVEVRLSGALDVAAELGRGFVLFHDGLGAGTEIIDRAGTDGLEELVRFERRPATEALVYDLELSDDIAGLRLVADTLELLDASGTPKMRVPPPAVVDAAGAWHWASLRVEGCAVDEDPVPPWGRVPTAPGSTHCGIRVGWSERGVAYPALVDPNFWTNTNAMTTSRSSHVAARITGNKVLVAGGLNASFVALSSAEVWDPSTGTWSVTGSMADTRYSFAGLATSSAGTSVLVAGGFSTTCASSLCDTSEEYRPTAGTFGSAAAMTAGRALFALSLLSSGTQVLATGGRDASATPLASAELYTISTKGWTATGSMTGARYYHAATALTGSVAVIVTGGRNGSSVLSSAEKWSGGTWSSAGTITARYGHTSSLLSGDHVLIAGGAFNLTGTCITRAQVWTSPTSWPTTTGGMTGGSARCFHAATTLTDGTVLIEGGSNAFGGSPLNTATLFDPTTSMWSAMPNLGTSRSGHTATLYDTTTPNKVLIAGGGNSGGILSACEYFTH